MRLVPFLSAVVLSLPGLTFSQQTSRPVGVNRMSSDSLHLSTAEMKGIYSKIVRSETVVVKGQIGPTGCSYHSSPMTPAPGSVVAEEGRMIDAKNCLFRITRTMREKPANLSKDAEQRAASPLGIYFNSQTFDVSLFAPNASNGATLRLSLYPDWGGCLTSNDIDPFATSQGTNWDAWLNYVSFFPTCNFPIDQPYEFVEQAYCPAIYGSDSGHIGLVLHSTAGVAGGPGTHSYSLVPSVFAEQTCLVDMYWYTWGVY